MHDVLKNMRIDLELRGLRDNTVITCLRCAEHFLRKVGKPPDELTRDDVRDYLLWLKRRGIAPASRNLSLTAIRLLSLTTLQRPELTAGLRRAKVRYKVPSVLSGSEVRQLLGAIRSLKHRAMVATLYGTGLRVSEMCRLRIQDIDPQRMRLRITDGKTGDGKMLARLRELYDRGQLLLDQAQADAWPVLLDILYHARWVVYCKPPFGGPEHVFRYLGRYTHRVAISNHGLLCVDGDSVTFRTQHDRTATCSRLEFLRRFIQHVLPAGLVRIRHYGLLAPRNVPTRLATARRLLSEGATFVPRPLRCQPADSSDWGGLLEDLTGVAPCVCPRCGHSGLVRQPLPQVRAPPVTPSLPRAV